MRLLIRSSLSVLLCASLCLPISVPFDASAQNYNNNNARRAAPSVEVNLDVLNALRNSPPPAPPAGSMQWREGPKGQPISPNAYSGQVMSTPETAARKAKKTKKPKSPKQNQSALEAPNATSAPADVIPQVAPEPAPVNSDIPPIPDMNAPLPPSLDVPPPPPPSVDIQQAPPVEVTGRKTPIENPQPIPPAPLEDLPAEPATMPSISPLNLPDIAPPALPPSPQAFPEPLPSPMEPLVIPGVNPPSMPSPKSEKIVDPTIPSPAENVSEKPLSKKELKEKKEAERKAKAEEAKAEKAKKEEERKAKIAQEKAKQEAERKAKAEEAKAQKVKLEAERKEQEAAEKKAKEEALKVKHEKKDEMVVFNKDPKKTGDKKPEIKLPVPEELPTISKEVAPEKPASFEPLPPTEPLPPEKPNLEPAPLDLNSLPPAMPDVPVPIVPEPIPGMIAPPALAPAMPEPVAPAPAPSVTPPAAANPPAAQEEVGMFGSMKKSFGKFIGAEEEPAKIDAKPTLAAIPQAVTPPAPAEIPSPTPLPASMPGELPVPAEAPMPELKLEPLTVPDKKAVNADVPAPPPPPPPTEPLLPSLDLLSAPSKTMPVLTEEPKPLKVDTAPPPLAIPEIDSKKESKLDKKGEVPKLAMPDLPKMPEEAPLGLPPLALLNESPSKVPTAVEPVKSGDLPPPIESTPEPTKLPEPKTGGLTLPGVGGDMKLPELKASDAGLLPPPTLADIKIPGANSDMKPLESLPVPVDTAAEAPSLPSEPTAPSTPPDLRIVFNSTETAVPLSMQDKLSGIANQLQNDKNLRVTIMAYAGGTKDESGASFPKRVSLARGVAIRNQIGDAITAKSGEDASREALQRMNVKAMGSKSSGGEPDRVDLFMMK
jgi:hypothetical protein